VVYVYKVHVRVIHLQTYAALLSILVPRVYPVLVYFRIQMVPMGVQHHSERLDGDRTYLSRARIIEFCRFCSFSCVFDRFSLGFRSVSGSVLLWWALCTPTALYMEYFEVAPTHDGFRASGIPVSLFGPSYNRTDDAR
jgi:hypothetical protein